MIYDYYQENSGYVSIWLGNFNDNEQLNDYLDTVYQDEHESDKDFAKKLAQLFVVGNQKRPYEREFRELYDEFYNQFAYDFGLTFEEDFREAVCYAIASNKLNQLIHDDFAFAEQFKKPMISKVGNDLPIAYNTIILLYDVNYDGHISTIHHGTFSLEFLGSIQLEEE